MATTGNDQYLTDLDIRIYMRDQDPAANKLLDDYEFSAEELRTALTLATDYYNEKPPIVDQYDYPNFPYRYNLLKGVCANLFFIAANSYRRNNLQYNIPGGAINDQDKAQQYDVVGERYWQEYKQWVDHIKRTKNIDSAWGTIG